MTDVKRGWHKTHLAELGAQLGGRQRVQVLQLLLVADGPHEAEALAVREQGRYGLPDAVLGGDARVGAPRRPQRALQIVFGGHLTPSDE